MSLHVAISAENPVVITSSAGVALALPFALTLRLLLPVAVLLVPVHMLTIMTVNCPCQTIILVASVS